MKSLKQYSLGTVGVALTLLLGVSCTKTFDDKLVSDQNSISGSTAQVFLATVGASRNYVYIDSKPVNGAALASGSLFPTTGYGFAIPAGQRALLVRDTLSTTTQAQLSFAHTFQAAKNYTFFVYDTITAPKVKAVETKIVVPADTSARIRFANFVYNPTIVPTVDIISFKQNATLVAGLQVSEVTDFMPYPSLLANDTIYIRETGTTNTLYKFTTGGLTPKRSYTVVYRGSYRGTKTASLVANY